MYLKGRAGVEFECYLPFGEALLQVVWDMRKDFPAMGVLELAFAAMSSQLADSRFSLTMHYESQHFTVRKNFAFP